MTGITLISVFSLALIDSINPSALLVTLVLLCTKSPARKVMVYAGTVFSVYLMLGIVLMLGLDWILGTFADAINSSGAYGIQFAAGAAMLTYAIMAPDKSASTEPAEPADFSTRTLILLGLTVTLLEAPTAIPYLAAIGILSSSAPDIASWLPILLVYNMIFIAPPMLLLWLQKMLGNRIRPALEKFTNWLRKSSRETFLWILGIVGFHLLANAAAHFGFFDILTGTASLN